MNACSIRNKLQELEAELRLYNYPDIAVICESRLTQSITQFFNITGYSAYHTTREDGFGGLSIYVKSNISHQITTDMSNVERVHISKVRLGQNSMNIFCVYRAPRSDLNRFFEQIDDIMERHSNVIVCGDMNLNLFSDTDPNVAKLKGLVESNSCVFLNSLERDQFTFPIASGPGAPGSLIDHFITDMLNKHYHLTNAPSIGDHHCLLLSVRDDDFRAIEQTMEVRHNPRIVRALKRYLTNLHNETLLQIHLEMTRITEENTFVRNLLDKTNHPWIDEQVIQEIRKKVLLYQLANQSNLTTTQRTIRRESFRIQKNKVTSMIRSKRNLFIDQQIQESMQDSTKMWQAMKLALNKKVSQSHGDAPEAIETPDGVTLKDPKQILDSLNNHFLTVGEKLNDEQHIKKGNRPRASTIEYECQSSMHLYKTNQHELLTIIHTLKNDAASGLDGISARNLKAVSRELSRKLVIPINECLKNAHFPFTFKEAKVKALYKGNGSKKHPSNYRPISVLCNMSKYSRNCFTHECTTF